MNPVLRIALVAAMTATPAALANELPAAAVNFQLTDHTGRAHEFYRLIDSPAVVLVTHDNGCGEMARQAPALQALQDEFGPKGVEFLALNPSPANDRGAVAARMEAWELDLPVLMDTSQTVARTLGFSRTAEAVVVTPGAEWAIAYRGALEEDALRSALNAVLAGEEAPDGEPAAGSAIDFSLVSGNISYLNDIAPILEEKCISCHHLGGIGPFAFSSLRRVRGWAPMMAETILTERMPPWHADEYHGDFRNSLALTDAERATLMAWLEDGAPDDLEGADDPLELAADLREQVWTLGEPDLVLSLAEAEDLPAEGVLEYRYRYIPSGLTEDKWVQAVEVQAGNPAVVHHALIFILYPKEYRHLQPDARGGLNGYFAAFLPGAKIEPYPQGSAQWAPAGSTFVFQLHYTATGRPEQDQTRMALYFADETPAYEFRVGAANTTDFRIPPHAANSVTRASYTFDEPATLWAASPHMHFRGSWFRFEVRPPDAEPRTVLNVPRFDFNWQPLYNFAEPVPLPAGTTIYCEGAFDNTRFNPLNPDPSATVTFGEQSWEEMFIGYLGYTLPVTATRREPLPADRTAEMGMGEDVTAENLVGTKWRLGNRVEIAFLEDGRALANGVMPGQWRIEQNRLIVDNLMQPIEIAVIGDELILMGRSMRFVRDGDPPFEAWQPGQGRGGRGPGGGQRGGAQGQGPAR